jgi:uncharacterized small protein (DUF1192 family)
MNRFEYLERRIADLEKEIDRLKQQLNYSEVHSDD